MTEPSPSPDADEGGYDAAVAALLSPLHQSATPEAIRAAAARRKNTLQDMHVYLQRLGLELNDGDGSAASAATTAANGDAKGGCVPPLIVHVTGTKGKGSTLSLCESILRRAHGLNTGMFTSPHLVSIRERIRINGIPISKKVFGEVYWRVRRKLEQFEDAGKVADKSGLPPLPVLPGYFRLIALMALYTFCHYEPKVDAILLEVGMGGRYDATNVFEATEAQTLVRGVTLIDYDHTRVLGSTLQQIAWEKAGIFVRNKLDNIGMDDGGYEKFVAKCIKDGSWDEDRDIELNDTVFASGSNTPEVLAMLRHVANANGCRLQIVSESHVESFREVGLQGKHQRANAALALALCQHALERYRTSHPSTDTSPPVSQEELQDALDGALAKAFWPGRCHTVPFAISEDAPIDGLLMNLRCDGAHTPVSINACIGWFRMVSSYSSSEYDNVHRVLVFNCSHERNPIPLLYQLCRSNLFNSIYFCQADFERPSAVPKRLEDAWAREPLGHLDSETLESMCGELATSNDDDTIWDVSKLSASTWQETLANVWRVLDAHQRKCSEGASSQPSPVNVNAGLKVEEALTAIQKEVASAVDCDGDSSESKQRALIEVCITGSLYIVGSALEAAGWEEGEASGQLR